MQKKGKTLIILSVALLALIISGCSNSSTSASTNEGAVVATYENGSLNESSLNEQLISKAGMQIMLDMIDKEILDVVEPVSEEMESLAESDLSNIKTYYGDQFESSLKINGFKDEAEFKNSLLLNSQRQAYAIKYIISNVLTEDEIKDYYDNYEPSIEASHILIKPEDDTDESDAVAEKKAKDLIVRIENGENFADLAKEFSEDPGSATNGGSLGSFSKGDMVEEFETAAFNLAIDEVTKAPIKSQFGYHIIKRTGGEEKKSFEEMKDEIENTLATEKLDTDQSIIYKALVQLREDNHLEIKNESIATQYSIFLEQMKSVSE